MKNQTRYELKKNSRYPRENVICENGVELDLAFADEVWRLALERCNETGSFEHEGRIAKRQGNEWVISEQYEQPQELARVKTLGQAFEWMQQN